MLRKVQRNQRNEKRAQKVKSPTDYTYQTDHYGSIVLACSNRNRSVFWNLHPESVKEVRKFQWPFEYDFFVLSPDGKKIACSRGEKLWIRRLDNIDPIEIKNDEVISNVIWSPNSDNIAYFTDAGSGNFQLKKVSLSGFETLIAKTKSNYYPRFWGRDDSILVTTWDGQGWNTLLKVPSAGGDLKPINGGDSALAVIRFDLSHVLELPDGNTLLLSVNHEGSHILMQTSRKRTTIYDGPPGSTIGRPVYSNSGHILCPIISRGSAFPDIWAIPFDLSSLRITGDQFLVARNADNVSISENGMLSYFDMGKAGVGEQLVLLSRSGQLLKNISQAQSEIYTPAISPDGRTIAAVSREGGGTFDIWLYDIPKGTKSQLSFDIPETWRPSWSPDGKEIVFQSRFFDNGDIYLQETNGRTLAKPLIYTREYEGEPYWSADGRFVLFSKLGTQPHAHSHIWYLEMGKENSPKPLFESRFNEDFPCSSPDGRFVAFQSDKSGRMEIYVTDFPDANQQWQVSFDGGVHPQWSGEEIFFVSPRLQELMSARIKTKPNFQSENPEKLFFGEAAGVELVRGYSFRYAVTSDGKNIFAVRGLGESNRLKVVLVENWIEEFKDKK